MTSRVLLSRDATFDVSEAAQWYAARGPGLGLEFTRAVRATLAAIRQDPLRHPVQHAGVRRALVRRFP